jgi:large subunit ribosomal protein L6
MSRIGKRFIEGPEKVTIKLDGQKISVDGPKGNLSRILPSLICCTLDDSKQKKFF